MPVLTPNPDRLFDRMWRPTHPLRPRVGRARIILTIATLAFLTGVIIGYSILTNTNRVRSMAANYLSELLHVPVHIDSAELTLFEGMRLDKVTIRLPRIPDGRSDARIFEANTVFIHYNLRDLLAGRLAATQIV